MSNHLATEEDKRIALVTERGRTGMAALGFFIGELREVLAYETGKALQGVNVRRAQGGWLLILKANQNGVSYVSFHAGETALDCYRTLWTNIHSNKLGWMQDKFG